MIYSYFILLAVISLTACWTPVYADDSLLRGIIELNQIFEGMEPDVHRPRSPTSRIDDIIRDAADRHRVDPVLIEAIIREESAFNARAVSNRGAMGLMQLMPSTANDMGVRRPFDPYENVMGGTAYYRLLYDRLGSERKALIAYHCGPRRVEEGTVPMESKLYAHRVIKRYETLKKRRIGT